MAASNPLVLYNTLTRKKEDFKPIHPDVVGMYVCGPTVYGDAHLGHAKSYVSFDLVYRYLMEKFPKVKYVQNITDVGHLTDDADAGDDKIAKQSRLEKIDPMAVVEKYMFNYFRDMDALNVLRPEISPRPSGHIPEQIEVIEDLIKKGFAYEVNGSVYFNIRKYNEQHNYGKLSGRTIDELESGSANRTLEAQTEKKDPLDFALWKKADDSHLMQWNSPWGKGFPGWHIECTVMSQKYLGDNFDIHGGGLENAFPHHECEIAQAEAHTEKSFANYWLHNNMVTVNGQKMGKSLGNGIFCHELFSGNNHQLDQPYSPMTVRFFILQSHYRSTLDFSNEALKAAEKGLKKLMGIIEEIETLKTSASSSEIPIQALEKELYAAMDDDFNSPMVIASIFEFAKHIKALTKGELQISTLDKETLLKLLHKFVFDILGLKKEEKAEKESTQLTDQLIELLVKTRNDARISRNFEMADYLRNKLLEMGIEIKDTKDGSSWEIY